jgi:EAL domain-containing protein (putative c-di-GMP-specific phosphodiesterase class I)/FixJ family two-component response regulator
LTNATPPSPERHAFIVDDEAQVRTFVANILVAAGFRAHQFQNSAEVELALAKQVPSIVVLDLSLGNSDAIEVIRNLAGIQFGGDVLLISGHDEATLEGVRGVGLHRGLSMLAPLHKPFRVDELRQRLASVIDVSPPATADISLKAALKNGWLELWYQPKIDLRTKLMCGAEALIRLRHPTQGLVQPGMFLPEAGDDLYHPLTDFVVRRALADWATFAKRRMTRRLAINVPASVLQRPDFVSTLRKHLPTHPDFPGLIVEITEDEAISDPELAREIAVQLKLYNVHVSIDDFGSGHSSLARLQDLPFAEIKLDRSFVQGCATDAHKRDMCQAVADLARRFGIVSVAEGVETREDLKVVSEIGYDVGQGFLFARPMSRDDFIASLASRVQKQPQLRKGAEK